MYITLHTTYIIHVDSSLASGPAGRGRFLFIFIFFSIIHGEFRERRTPATSAYYTPRATVSRTNNVTRVRSKLLLLLWRVFDNESSGFFFRRASDIFRGNNQNVNQVVIVCRLVILDSNRSDDLPHRRRI